MTAQIFMVMEVLHFVRFKKIFYKYSYKNIVTKKLTDLEFPNPIVGVLYWGLIPGKIAFFGRFFQTFSCGAESCTKASLESV